MADAFIKKISAPNFQPDQYVQELAATSEGEGDLAAAKQKVQALSDETNALLKKNVYKNYHQFIETAKEISYLESEMYQLSHMLTEQKDLMLNLSQYGERFQVPNKDIPATPQPPSPQIQEKEDPFKSHTSLLEKVEGWATVMQVPGRTVIHSSGLVEMDPSTLSPVQRVHAFLVTDCVVVTTWMAHRRGPVRYQFQALYELDSLAVVNVRDAPNLKNAFKLLMFRDTRMFLCENPQTKQQWLDLIDSAKKSKISPEIPKRESVVEKPKEEKLDDDDESDGYDYGDDDMIPPLDEEIPDWLTELPEDLDVCIAQRDFEEAVNLIDKANEYFLVVSGTPLLKEVKTKMHVRIRNLTDVLMNELRVSPDKTLQGGPRAARRAVLLLIKLGKSTQACDLFLKHRTAVLRQSIKQLKIEGSTTVYIKRLCGVFFSHLMETGKEFLKAFPNHKSCCSALVIWAHAELSKFATNFSRQVFTPQTGLSSVAECVSLAVQHCSKLADIGLELTFDLTSLLHSEIQRALVDCKEKLIEAIKLRAAEDRWRPLNLQSEASLEKFIEDLKELGSSIRNYVYDKCWISVTTPTIQFCKTFLNYVDDSLKLVDGENHNLVMEGWCAVFRAECKHMQDSFNSEKFKNETELIQKNARFLCEVLLPLVDLRYKEKLGIHCYQLEEMKRTLTTIIDGKPTITSKKYTTTIYL